MPSSGSLNGNHVADGDEFVYLDWQVATQEINNNRSLINWQVGWKYVTYGCRGLRNGNATINGLNVYHDYDAGDGVHVFNGSHNHKLGTGKLQTASGSLWIAHNPDGTQVINIQANMTGFNGQYSSDTELWTLPTIPRFSGPPSTPVITELDQDSFRATFTDGSGGAPIDSRQLAYGTTPSVGSATIIASDGSDIIASLTTGTTYYVWARTHNAAGYSEWSAMATTTTWRVPDAPSAPTISAITQIGAVVSWTAPFNGGTAITSYQVGYGTSPTTPTTTVTATSPKSITGLTPGTKYYFFVRAINVVGTGPWSVPSNATMIAGSRVNVGGVWKMAVPYVRVGGVWTLARPWVKVLGVWKETI